ncbi:MAG: Do family serine endopeptidase [Kangiellaceae bacterium]|jgi:serine protease Do/serine protease DegQ|nr:Do family serine endopeptidase [Kangiellaceae bacterium]
MPKNRFILVVITLVISLGQTVNAGLPTAVNGQPLPSLAPMLEQANPAIVNIATTATIETPMMRDPIFGFLVPGRKQRQANSLGSGVIVDSNNGYIITNHHVIAGADEIQVALVDGRELIAEVIGSDEKTDVALLKVDSDRLTDIPLGQSNSLLVGDFVVAIGNPFGLGHSVTSGIVSAKGRSGLGIEQYEDFIQTDAAINPGNSGGALVNLKGELVGINTAILGPKGNIGIGFAIPIDLAKTIMNQLLQFGEVKRGLLGVTVQELTPPLARALGVNKNYGVVVTEVTPKSTAEQAGLKTTDILLAINGRKLKTRGDLLNQEGLIPAGSEIVLDMLRDGKSSKVTVILEQSPTINKAGVEFHPLLEGVTLSYTAARSNNSEGLEISELNSRSRAAYFGIEVGDIIQGVGRYRVRNFGQLADVMPPKNRALALRILRDGEQFLVILR